MVKGKVVVLQTLGGCMTSPIEQIIVQCPGCEKHYQDWWRPSVNLDLDDFDEEYLEQVSTATCPKCGLKVNLDTLIVGPNDIWMARSPITPALMHAILDQYILPTDGIHGVLHWARVYENGMYLAPKTGTDSRVVALFSVFHDACRLNENSDPEHGKRGANLAASFRGTHFDLPDDMFERLYEACVNHTHSRTHQDIMIKTCWDSDRLDLGRVGIVPNPKYLCTDAAKTASCIEYAFGRSIEEAWPEWISEQWGIQSK